MADGVGISSSAVHRYASGIGEPTTATLEKLAKWSGYSVEWLRGQRVNYNKFAVQDELENLISYASDLIELHRTAPDKLKYCISFSVDTFFEENELLIENLQEHLTAEEKLKLDETMDLLLVETCPPNASFGSFGVTPFRYRNQKHRFDRIRNDITSRILLNDKRRENAPG